MFQEHDGELNTPAPYPVSQVIKEVLIMKRDKLFDNYLRALEMISAWSERVEKDPELEPVVTVMQMQAKDTSAMLVWYDEAITGKRDTSFVAELNSLPEEEVVGNYKQAHQHDQ